MSRKNKPITLAESVESYSRESSSAKYMKKRHGRSLRKILAAVGVSFLVILLAGVGVAWAYVSNLNRHLSSGITQETIETLVDEPDGEPFYLLLIGIDKDTDRAHGTYGASDSGYRSDSIIVVRIDPGTRKVSMLSIHRDTKIELAGYGVQKINAAFAFGGPPLTIKTIGSYVGVDISHYAEIDMDGLVDVVDAVGGIDVDLPIPVVDLHYTGLNLQAGEQHIDGKTAMLLCRARHAYDSYGDGDTYRAANQRLVIKAVIERILDSDPATMVATVTAMAEMINTDYSVSDIVTLANQMRGIDVSRDIMSGMQPTEGLFENNLWYEVEIEPDWTNMKERFREGMSLYDGGSYDATVGVSAELSNGRDTGELPEELSANEDGEESVDDASSADEG